MLAKSKGQPVLGASGVTTTNEGLTVRHSVTEPGLYYKKGSEYFELMTENVEWKTKGAMDEIVSAGIVRRNSAGSLAGPRS
jgi:hypothetical protein